MSKETTNDAREWWSSLTQAERDGYMRKHRTEVDKVFGIEHEQPASVTGRESGDRWRVHKVTPSRATSDVILYEGNRRLVLLAYTQQPLLEQIATEHNNYTRLHEQNERLREALRQTGEVVDALALGQIPAEHRYGELCRVQKIIDAALNHAE